MINKTIHYCWFGRGPKSPIIERCLKSWTRVMPDYEVRQWNEDNSPKDLPYMKYAGDQKAWAFLSDYVRLHALATEGGVYLDTDVEVIRPFDPLLGNDCFAGFQLASRNEDWVGTAVVASTAGHPLIERWKSRTLDLFNQTGAFHRGPAILTSLLTEMGLKTYGLQHVDGVTLYPTEYFYPYAWFESFSPRYIKHNTYAIHHWSGSWMGTAPLPIKAILSARDLFEHLFQR